VTPQEGSGAAHVDGPEQTPPPKDERQEGAQAGADGKGRQGEGTPGQIDGFDVSTPEGRAAYIAHLAGLPVAELAQVKKRARDALGMTAAELTEAVKAARKAAKGNGAAPADGEPVDTEAAVRESLGLNQAPQMPKRPAAVAFDDFYAYLPGHAYVFMPTRELWPAVSVNAVLPGVARTEGKPMKPSRFLDRERPVLQMTWAPGEPEVIRNKLMNEGGWAPREGANCLNLYIPPAIKHGDASKAGPWLEHVCYVYPGEAEHIIRFLAHRVQRPGDKVNHAVVLGGSQGIGKDTLLEPVKYAIGPWNLREVSPAAVLGRFNGHVKSVILRVSEARDLGTEDHIAFYEHMKTLSAAPPDMHNCDEKNLREHKVPNVCGVIVTTNHKAGGIHIPRDDRRYFVAWSERTMADFATDYWLKLYDWYADGGYGHVAAYLASLDLSGWNPKATPPKTQAWHEIVNAGRAPECSELADALDELAGGGERPDAVTLDMLARAADSDFALWLRDRRNSRLVPYRLEDAGYVSVRNAGQTEGRWKVAGKNVAIYAKQGLAMDARIAAARAVQDDKPTYTKTDTDEGEA
jgi:hypothetical protein